MQLIEIKNVIKNGSSKVHFLLIGRCKKWEKRGISFPSPTFNGINLKKSPSLDSLSTVQDPRWKFQPNSLLSWGTLAIEAASRGELHCLHPNPNSGQWGVRSKGYKAGTS